MRMYTEDTCFQYWCDILGLPIIDTNVMLDTITLEPTTKQDFILPTDNDQRNRPLKHYCFLELCVYVQWFVEPCDFTLNITVRTRIPCTCLPHRHSQNNNSAKQLNWFDAYRHRRSAQPRLQGCDDVPALRDFIEEMKGFSMYEFVQKYKLSF